MLLDLFYKICFSLSIVASAVSLLFGLLMITIVLINRPCHTLTNLMLCNTAVMTMIYSVLQLVSSYYGLRKDWLIHQPGCIFRAYCYVAVCIAVSGSYAIHSISRFFFSVLYRHKHLLTWRTHYFLIFISYVFTLVGPIPPILFGYGYAFEVESRLCLATTKVLYSSMLAVIIAYLIPLSIVLILYTIIIFHARQSVRRVFALKEDRPSHAKQKNSIGPNFKREMKLMKNIFILIGILVCAGIPYLTMVIWHAASEQPPPKAFYLLTMVNISLFFLVKIIVLFVMNKDVRMITFNYLRKL